MIDKIGSELINKEFQSMIKNDYGKRKANYG
jgi:hypothetical protein